MFGWVEAGEHLRFPLEPGEPVRISREGVGEDLQRDVAAELRVGGAIDLAHAAYADEGGHVIVPEAGADGQGHDLARRDPCREFFRTSTPQEERHAVVPLVARVVEDRTWVLRERECDRPGAGKRL